MAEKLARSQIKFSEAPPDYVPILYVLLGKFRSLHTLLKTTSGRLGEFFLLEFNDPANRLKASKNAFACLGKQKYCKSV